MPSDSRPTPQPPADGEVAELVLMLHHAGDALRLHGVSGTARACDRAAELLERPAASPAPEVREGPTDQELLRLYKVATPCYHVEEYKRELDFARAVLARFGAVPPAPEVREEYLNKP